MPADGPSMEKFRVVCPCGIWANSEPVDTFGTTPAEEFNIVAASMAPLGWQIGAVNEAGNRTMLCPGCARATDPANEVIETVRLPIYRATGPCPKCLVRIGIETVYRRGDEPKRAYPMEPACESLLRICGRCGYRWSEACKSLIPNEEPEKPQPAEAMPLFGTTEENEQWRNERLT